MNAQQRAARNQNIRDHHADGLSPQQLANIYNLTVATIKRILTEVPAPEPITPLSPPPSQPEPTQVTPVVVSYILHQTANGEAYELTSLADVEHELGGEVSMLVNGGVYCMEVNDLARLIDLVPGDPVPSGYGVHYQTPPDDARFTAVIEQYHVRRTGQMHQSWGNTELLRYEFWVFYDRSGNRPHLLPTLWYPCPLSLTRSLKSTVQFVPIPKELALV